MNLMMKTKQRMDPATHSQGKGMMARVDVLTTFSDDHRNSRLIQRCK